MIIIKTNMTKIPNSCKECDMKVVARHIIMCSVLHDFMDVEEYRNGRIKFEKCPLEEE